MSVRSIVIVGMLIGCNDPARPSPEKPVEPPLDTSALDAYFDAQFPADQPGIAVLIAKRGQTVFSGGWGLADLETREKITTSTLFNLGSLTKTIVASAVLILQERGALSVDAPLTKYFAFKDPELAAKVQVRHLLTHTSGLPDLRRVEEQRELYLTANDAENWYPVTQAEALEFEPGTRFAYSNPAYNALALIVEQVSGRKWQTFVREEIFVPAGMTTSTITERAHPERGVAHAYVRVDGGWAEMDFGEVPTFAAAGNGGAWSSVDELARYEQALTSGVFLPTATVEDARTVKTFPNWASDEPPMLGWSWFVRELDGLVFVGHTGGQGGFETNYVVIPDKDVLVVFLTNAPTDFDGVTTTLLDWLRERNWLD